MSSSILIKNCSELVTCSGFQAKVGKAMSDLAIISDGAIVIENGLITQVGKNDQVLASLGNKSHTVIDASGKAVLPGFVDAHTHLLFAGYRPDEFCLRLQGVDYLEILKRGGGILDTVRATRAASAVELFQAGRKRLDTMLSFGVTTVESKSGYGLDLDTELKQLQVMEDLDREHPIDIVRTFLGAHAVPDEYRGRDDSYLDSVLSGLKIAVA